MREDAQRWYPAPAPYDEALAELHDSEKEGQFHIPTFARRTLRRLREKGLLHTPDNEPLANVRKVKWGKEGKEQELWVRFDTHRADAGYMAVEVVDPPRSDAAILAAMTAWLVDRPVNFEQVLETMRFMETREYQEQVEKTDAFHQKVLRKDPDIKPGEFTENFTLMVDQVNMHRAFEPLEYVVPLLQHYKPEFANLPPKEQWALVEKTCGYIDNFLESLRKLQAFLEYGATNRKLEPAIREPQRDVRAAILHDVSGLSYRAIGERFGIPLPPDFEVKGEHQTVRKMVHRGREILTKAFGEEGWRERVEAMKRQEAWWRSLSPEERDKETDIEMTALDLGIPIEEARRRSERRGT